MQFAVSVPIAILRPEPKYIYVLIGYRGGRKTFKCPVPKNPLNPSEFVNLKIEPSI